MKSFFTECRKNWDVLAVCSLKVGVFLLADVATNTNLNYGKDKHWFWSIIFREYYDGVSLIRTQGWSSAVVVLYLLTAGTSANQAAETC